MAISQLYPTQRPALDLNFARQKRLDSRVTFTRGSTATYVGSDGLIKTAASGEARFDHDPATGESLGLLVEESRTNLITYSAEFDNAAWIKHGGATKASVTPNTHVAPDGTVTADTLQDNVTNNYGRIYLAAPPSASPNTIYTFSIYVAKDSNTSRIPEFVLSDGAGVSLRMRLNTSTGEIYEYAYAGGLFRNSYIQSIDNYWKLVMTVESSASASTMQVEIRPAMANSFTANQTYSLVDSIVAWGAQLEAGTYPTSYIPTSGSTVTRSADVASLTNSSIYDTDSFTILNEPFGSAAGGSTLSLVGAGETPIKRTAVYSQDLTQTQINASVGKTDEFWRWRILGDSFGLPDFTTDGQVTVDWGDGTVETLTTSDHTFTNGGGYHEVGFRLDSGTYFKPQIYNDANHKTKVVALGPAPESMVIDGSRSFWGCSNLESFDATVDATGGGSLYRAWNDCNSLTSFPLIDTSSVTDFYSAWYNNSLTSFPLLDTSSGTNFYSAWQSCSSLTSFPLIDTSSGTNFQNAWYNCNSLTSFPAIDTSSGTNFTATWEYCSGLTSFPLINTASGDRFTQTWSGCSSLTSFPSIDTSSATITARTWRYCSSLTSFPLLDLSNSTNFEQCWNGCTGLTSFPLIDTSSGTNFAYAWQDNNSLTSFPSIDTSSATTFDHSWYNCSSLTSFPLLDTSSGTNFYQTWRGCSFTSFPSINTSAGTNFGYAWYGNNSLTTFPANFFDSWTGTPVNNCFLNAWLGCNSLTATSVENILNSIDTSGQSAPASGVDITIDYDTGTGTPSISTAVTNLKSRGWTITLNGVAQ